MMTTKDTLKSLSQSHGLMPQEEMLEVGQKKSNLYIGIPKETSFQEHRVALVPESVAVLANNGHRVVVQRDAGKESNFSDTDYSEAGAEIIDSVEDVFKADILLKVAPPSMKEIDMMQQRQTLLSALQLTVQPKDFLKKLMNKRITAIAWDYVQDDEKIVPVVRAMGEIAGLASIQIAAEYLSNDNGGQGAILGGISGVPPTEVVIIGAGTVGEFATRAALGMGASVKVFDNNIYKLRRLQQDIGTRVYTSIIQPTILKQALSTADVAIGAIRARSGRTPCIVSEEMVEGMKDCSVVVDVSIDQGGCFETSSVTNHDNPTFMKHGVIHYCVPNIASRVSRTASYALSNIFAPITINIGDKGGVENILHNNMGVRNGVYLYKGTLTNSYLGETYNLPFKDLNLLMAAF